MNNHISRTGVRYVDTEQDLKFKISLSLLLILSLTLTNCTDRKEEQDHNKPQIHVIKESSYQGIQKAFQRLNYHADQLDLGAPPIVVQTMPENLTNMINMEKRKWLFFKIVLPLVLLVNEEILLERRQLLDIENQFKSSNPLTEEQSRQLEAIATRYRLDLDTIEPATVFDILLRRVDIVPVDLALAQAANESAWGTSRFTRIANNLFGEWTFTPGTGIVPENRPEGEIYEVRKFPTIYDSVRSYANNLNSHRAYRKFRLLRAQQKTEESTLNGLTLAEGLISYSIRGDDYIQEIQAMIRQNNLDRLASVSLRNQ